MNYCLNRLMLVILFMMISLTGTVDAGWWNAGWQYRKGISINNTDAALTDIRFEQSGAELSYWFEKWNYANTSALVWGEGDERDGGGR